MLKSSILVFNLCWLLTLLPDFLLRSVPGTLPNSRWSALSVDSIRHTLKRIRVTHGQKGSLLFGIFLLKCAQRPGDMFTTSNVVTLWLVPFSMIDEQKHCLICLLSNSGPGHSLWNQIKPTTYYYTLRIMGSQVTGGLEIQDKNCKKHIPTSLFCRVQGPVILRVCANYKQKNFIKERYQKLESTWYKVCPIPRHSMYGLCTYNCSLRGILNVG